jgi:hypothetical protein
MQNSFIDESLSFFNLKPKKEEIVYIEKPKVIEKWTPGVATLFVPETLQNLEEVQEDLNIIGNLNILNVDVNKNNLYSNNNINLEDNINSNYENIDNLEDLSALNDNYNNEYNTDMYNEYSSGTTTTSYTQNMNDIQDNNNNKIDNNNDNSNKVFIDTTAESITNTMSTEKATILLLLSTLDVLLFLIETIFKTAIPIIFGGSTLILKRGYDVIKPKENVPKLKLLSNYNKNKINPTTTTTNNNNKVNEKLELDELLLIYDNNDNEVNSWNLLNNL